MSTEFDTSTLSADIPWQRLHEQPLLALLADFLTGAESQALTQTLEKDIAWESPSLKLYGRDHIIPRAQCWMGDASARYRYSGRTLTPEPWHPALEALRDHIVACLERSALPVTPFNSVLLNRYLDGTQRMGWHSDNEPELGSQPVIASLSLGSERPLRFRRIVRHSSSQQSHSQVHPSQRPEQAFNVWLPDGSLLLMGPGAQETWQHALAPRAIPGKRFNLTFRYVHSAG